MEKAKTTTYAIIPPPERSYALSWFERPLPDFGRDEWLTATLTNRISDNALLRCTTVSDLENYVGYILDQAYAADVRVFDDWTDPVRWLWSRRRRLVVDQEGNWIGLLTHALSSTSHGMQKTGTLLFEPGD
jgi:hypothetical protein